MVVRRSTGLFATALLVASVAACSEDSAPPATAPPFGADDPVTASAPSSATGASIATDESSTSLPGLTTTPVSMVPVATTSVAAPTSAPAPTVVDAATTTTVAPAPLGPLSIIDTQLDPDGTLPLLPALELVAAAYGPIPDIEAATQPLVDGGPALRAVLAQLDEVSDEQRAAVLRIVDLPHQSIVEAADADGLLEEASGFVDLSIGTFTSALNRELPDGIEITLVELPYENADGSHNFSSPEDRATAIPWTSSPDVPYDECRIRVNTDATAPGAGDPAFLSAVAQETFHCFQFGLRPNGAGVPLWVFEGAAAFAGEMVSEQGSALSTPWWERWITEPQRPLDRRTYDAVGFFFLLDELGLDAFGVADVLLIDATPDSVRRRLDSSGVFDRWGSQYATQPSWGEQFAIAGLHVPAISAPQSLLALTVDGERVNAAGLTSQSAMSATPYTFVVPGDVLVITSGLGDRGTVRFGDGTTTQLTEGAQAYCLEPTGCLCPGVADPSASPAVTPVTSTEVFIGIGPFSGDGPQLAARSLERWCNEVLAALPPDGALDPCVARDWTSTGYDVTQPAGVALTATGGSGAVVRFEPDGTTTVDLDASESVVLTATDADGATTTTTLTYRGNGAGLWRADPASGVINITDVPTATFTLRVTVTTSGGGVLADTTLAAGDPRLSAYADLLGVGRYRCSAAELSITHVTPSVGGDAGFRFS